MPIYEYQCEGCGEVFELIQKFSDQPLTVHEKCGAPVHRMITSSAIQFKGSGWYATDYAKGGNGSKKSDSEKSEKKESGDASSKTESKSGESKAAASDKPPSKKSSD
jgi:putative FmdB family regulatory protein